MIPHTFVVQRLGYEDSFYAGTNVSDEAPTEEHFGEIDEAYQFSTEELAQEFIATLHMFGLVTIVKVYN